MMMSIDEKRLEDNKRKQIIELKNNELILSWLKENNLPLTIVDEYYVELAKYLKINNTCQNCHGLEECLFRKKGHYQRLVNVNGLLTFDNMSCHYYEENQSKYQHRNNIVVCDMSNEQLCLNPNQIGERDDMSDEEFEIFTQTFEEFDLNNLPRRGKVFYGNPGVGKTFSACCLINSLAKNNVKCAFVNVPLLINRLKETMNSKNTSYHQEVNLLKKVDVLVLDDIGSEQITSWTRDDILLPILNKRMEDKKLTYFTSNYDEMGLINQYAINKLGNRTKDSVMAGRRIVERVKALAEFTKIGGKSQRYFK